MCRDRTEGGRRCPHDTTEARRNRRQNSKIVDIYEDSVIEGVTPEANAVENTSNPSVVITKAKTVLSEYNDIQARIGPAPTVPLWHSTKLSNDEILAEQKLIELGDTIEELAIANGCPTEEEIIDESAWIEDNQIELKQKAAVLSNKFRSETGITVDYKNGEYSFAARGWYKTIDEAVEQYNEWRGENLDVEKARASFEEYKGKREELYSEMDTRITSLNAMISDRSDAYRKALSDIGVEFAGADDLTFKSETEGSDTLVRNQVALYPKAWIDNSNSLKKKLSVKEIPGERAGYDEKTGMLVYDAAQDGDSIMMHELGHRMEQANPEISEAERRFLNRRAGFVDYHAGKTLRLPEFSPVNRNAKEQGYPQAGFANDYTAKVYDIGKYTDTPAKRAKYIEKHGETKGSGFYEVLTMGVETTFYGKNGAGVGIDGMKKDPEHTRFVLGLFASTAK